MSQVIQIEEANKLLVSIGRTACKQLNFNVEKHIHEKNVHNPFLMPHNMKQLLLSEFDILSKVDHLFFTLVC